MATKTKTKKSTRRTPQKKTQKKVTSKAVRKTTSKAISGQPSAAQDRMVRLLMTLSEYEEDTVRRGAVNKRLPRRSKSKNESTKTYSKAMGVLGKEGALSEEKGVLTLNYGVIRDRLLAELTQPGFAFQGPLGMGKANVLLALIQELAVAPPSRTNGNGKVKMLKPITSYDDFKTIVLATFAQLKRDYNFDRLVPIYRIRREIGERVSRTQFSEWLFEMQAEDILELLEQSVEDGAPDKIEDSVTTSMGKLRCYAKRLDV